MSAVAAFALECANAGRWARGMLALQPSLPSNDPHIRHAAVALAAVAAPHNLEASVSLLDGNYTLASNELIGRALDALSRNHSASDAVFYSVASPLLQRAAAADGEAACELFCHATLWRGSQVARDLAKDLSSMERSCQDRVALLQRWKEEDDQLSKLYFPLALPPVGVQRSLNRQEDARRRVAVRHFTARDHRERVRLQAHKHREAHRRVVAEHQANVVAAFAPSPSWWSVTTLLRLAPRPRHGNARVSGADDVHISWRSALAILGDQPILPEMELAYIRCIGLCAPEKWEEGLERLGKTEQLTEERRLARLWLASRGSPSAAAAMIRLYIKEAEEKAHRDKDFALLDARKRWGEELVSRSAVPSSTFVALFPVTAATKPWFRLERDNGKSSIARALASGIRLDEIQLSAPVKEWAKNGDWHAVLSVYWRFPSNEMQRRAVEVLLSAVQSRRGTTRAQKASPALPALPETLSDLIECVTAIPQSRKNISLCTHCACLLIKAAASDSEALSLLRQCVRHGTQCNAQLLSAVMDKKPQHHQLKRLLENYPGAVNAGIARRAKEDFGIAVKPHARTVAAAERD